MRMVSGSTTMSAMRPRPGTSRPITSLALIAGSGNPSDQMVAQPRLQRRIDQQLAWHAERHRAGHLGDEIDRDAHGGAVGCLAHPSRARRDPPAGPPADPLAERL